MIGQTISHYQILEKLGEGGMGVVYKAQDTKLDRLVALKFLPSQVSGSEQDKARFVQEAKAAAALNHPNICTIHGIEEHESHTFIVMEFVEGQTLREKFKAQTTNLKSTIGIGVQLADGLTVAHEKGIVHRDLKPENIMLQKDGRVRIMDFGLAKLKGASRLTKAGSTVGTTGYMSPEQVQGLESDHRSDIFSLGVILYELFSGQSPFKGMHETAINYEIVNVDPEPMSVLKPETDPELDRIVLECLAKEPSERYQSVAEVAKELRRHKRESSRSRMSRVRPVSSTSRITSPSLDEAMPATTRMTSRREIIAWAAAVALLVTASVLAYLHFFEINESAATVRFEINPLERMRLGSVIAVSPDGKYLVFVATDSTGKRMLWVRPFDDVTMRPLPGTEEGTQPFWSPDNRFIGFFADNKLKKADLLGGPVQTLCEARYSGGGTWNQDGDILFAPEAMGGLYRVSSAGGNPTQITTPTAGQTHRWPMFLPDGRRFLYLVLKEEQEILLGSLDSKETRPVLQADTRTVFMQGQNSSFGHLFWVRNGILMAQPFDSKKAETVGESFPIDEGISYNPLARTGTYTSSQSGVLVYGKAEVGNRHLVWFDRDGRRLGTVGETNGIFQIALSPEEGRVAIERVGEQANVSDLWTLDLARRVYSRQTTDKALRRDPIWSPKGDEVLFWTTRSGKWLLVARKVGSGEETVLHESSESLFVEDWSRDGQHIVFNVRKSDGMQMMILPLEGDRKPWKFLETQFGFDEEQFSPDGKWIAYMHNETGSSEVYIQSFPKPMEAIRVSTNGGGAPRWRRDGKELFYIASDGMLMSVDIKAGSALQVGVPRGLFQTGNTVLNLDFVAITGDGKRFLVNQPVGQAPRFPYTVVLNWRPENHRIPK